MSPRSMLITGGAAILGAVAWGVISYVTNYEVGYVAWGIGAAVGGTAAALGGRGSKCGVICALMALGAIFLGKMLAVQFTISGELDKIAGQGLSQTQYDESVQEAKDFAALTSPDEYPKFMVEHGYTEAKNTKQVTPTEVSDFEKHSIPALRWVHTEKPSYKDWRERRTADLHEAFAANVSIAGLVVDNLGAFDVLFAFLGVSTAYRIPARREDA